MIIQLNPLKWFAKPAVSAPAVASESLQQSVAVKTEEKSMKSFFERITTWIKAHFTHLPAEEVAVSSAANYVVPFIEELDELVTPELAPVVNPVLDNIKTGLAALATTIEEAKTPAGTTNVEQILASLTSNAKALEAAFQVKDAATQQKVSGLITLISGEFTAIQTQFAPVTPATPAAASGATATA